ncbi:MAG: glycosyl transferase [Fimbriimonadaceae bacterium]
MRTERSMANQSSCEVPVLLIAFNRPDDTEKALNAIRAAKPKRLYVSVDGPRANRDGEAHAVEAVVKLFDRVDWPCDVELRRNATNLGCCEGVASAISWLFEHSEAGIILEDDCIADPTFFPYCTELLARYAEDRRVGLISGTSNGLTLNTHASYGFSKYASIWGWASWRRAWSLFDARITDWPTIDAAGLIEAVLDDPREIAFWKTRFAAVFNHSGPDNWDYQWMITQFLNRMACIVPGTNLINNIGSGPQSTHMNPLDPDLHRPTSPMSFPLVHPKYLVIDKAADRQAMRERFSVKPLHRRIGGRIKREMLRAKRNRGA